MLGVVSQHRFDDSSQFLKKAIDDGPARQDSASRRLREVVPVAGVLFAAHQGKLGGRGRRRADQPGDPPGGYSALADGPASKACSATGNSARCTRSNREDVVSAVVRYAIGATGVIQASTAFWPGYTERLEIHGTKGTAIISGDKLTTWDVEDDSGDPRAARARCGLRRVGSDGDFARAVRAPVPRFRRSDSRRPQAAGIGRRRLSGAGTGGRDLSVLPRGTRRSLLRCVDPLDRTLRVPASSANLGPGFDALGLALGIYLECRFRAAPALTIRVTGRDADR